MPSSSHPNNNVYPKCMIKSKSKNDKIEEKESREKEKKILINFPIKEARE